MHIASVPMIPSCFLILAILVVLPYAQCGGLGPAPYVIAHRGASGRVPEHTIKAYEVAVADGADFIECDVVLTKDLEMVCRHEPNLIDTTNAIDLFPQLLRNVTVDNQTVEGIFASDLLLSEVRRLRARQATSARDQSWNDLLPIPTFQEFINVALSANRVVGVYPEIKHPSWHNELPQMRAVNQTIEQMVLGLLHKNNYTSAFGTASWFRRPAFVQNFELKSLKLIKSMTNLPLVLLLEDGPAPDSGLGLDDLTSDAGLEEIARYATGVGPWKGSLAEYKSGQLQSTGLVERLHNKGLLVHPYTFRDESRFILQPLRESGPEAELKYFLEEVGIDGAFTDFPGTLSKLDCFAAY